MEVCDNLPCTQWASQSLGAGSIISKWYCSRFGIKAEVCGLAAQAGSFVAAAGALCCYINMHFKSAGNKHTHTIKKLVYLRKSEERNNFSTACGFWQEESVAKWWWWTRCFVLCFPHGMAVTEGRSSDLPVSMIATGYTGSVQTGWCDGSCGIVVYHASCLAVQTGSSQGHLPYTRPYTRPDTRVSHPITASCSSSTTWGTCHVIHYTQHTNNTLACLKHTEKVWHAVLI